MDRVEPTTQVTSWGGTNVGFDGFGDTLHRAIFPEMCQCIRRVTALKKDNGGVRGDCGRRHGQTFGVKEPRSCGGGRGHESTMRLGRAREASKETQLWHRFGQVLAGTEVLAIGWRENI